MSNIQNLNKPKDAFEQLEEESGQCQSICHIRIQQRTGRKTITTVQGIATEYDLKKIVRYLKKSTSAYVAVMKTFVGCLIVRLASVFLIKTSFAPDEIFQSLEPAHNYVFGSGHLTWEWSSKIRSPFHVLLISGLYQVLQLCGIDSTWTIIHGPRILHAILFAVGDYYFTKLASKILKDKKAEHIALLLILTNWFMFYCGPRTLSNSLECVLTTIALNYYPFDKEKKIDSYTNFWYIPIGLFSTCVRPTSVLLYIPLGINHLWQCEAKLRLLFVHVIPHTVFVLLVSQICDFWFYQTFDNSLWNFAKFNVFDGGSAFFGTNPWYYYLLDGLPALLTVNMATAVAFVALPAKKPSLLLYGTGVFYVLIHSLLPHKEHRFMLPVLPIFILYSAYFIRFLNLKRFTKMYLSSIGLSVALNLSLIFFFGTYHQAGPNETIQKLHSILPLNRLSSIYYLTPCYNLPQYSYFHDHPVQIEALDCQPNLKNISGYVSPSTHFIKNASTWFEENKKEVLSSDYIVIYQSSYEVIKNGLEDLFEICYKSYHGPIDFNCNGTLVEHPEYGQVIQLSGDQRNSSKAFLCRVGIVKDENCKVHGF
uniref:Mannosyltransferase n=1 Tax=Rhabditophanes sp. KR3021 TaxID=114890 RepID=A0AC35UC90_9BILA